jgi:cell division protein FtsQ
MSNAYALRNQQGADAPAGGRLSRWARPLLIAISAVSAIALAGRFIGEPVTRIHHVVVHSDLAVADDQLLALSGLSGGEHWYSVSPAALEKRLEANPLVRQARVEKVFPDTLRMTVWGRVPAAVVLAASGGRTVPVLVDGDGVVYKIGSTSAEIDLPVISGISAGDTALGSALPRAYGRIFSDLRALRAAAPALYALVSEVKVSAAPADDAQGPGSFDLLLFLTCSPVPVRARGAIDETLLRSTLMVLDLLSRQGVVKNIQELDFRSGDVVYKVRAQGAAAGERGTAAGSARVTADENARNTADENARSTADENARNTAQGGG